MDEQTGVAGCPQYSGHKIPHESQYAFGSTQVQRDRFELTIANRFERQQRSNVCMKFK